MKKFNNFETTIEADYSQAAFFIVAALIGKKPITIKGLNKDSIQGDAKIIDVIKQMGAKFEFDQDLIVRPSQIKGINIDMSNIPDLGPALSVLGAFAIGETRLLNIERLKIKESNRVTCVIEELSKFKIKIYEENSQLVIRNYKFPHYHGVVSTHGDHRIAMMLAILMNFATGQITLDDESVVNKSYPNFWVDYKNLNGEIYE